MNALLRQVMGSIDPSVVQQVAGKLGIPQDQAQSAIGSAMPAILGAIGQRASTPDGADAVHATAQQHAGMGLSQIMGMVGGASGAQGVLGQLLGGHHDATVQGVAGATGLSSGHASQIMSMLGPVVMSAIGNHAQQGGMNAQGLGQILGGLGQSSQSTGGLGGMLGQIGSLFGKH